MLLTILKPSNGTEERIADAPRQMPVPACFICGADSTGIHFGVEACAACSAFFRRTVVLSKTYVCAKDNQCEVVKAAPNAQKCRACRFRKCNEVGMDRSAVQHRRDAIGKYSSMVKREYPSSPSNDRSDSCSSTSPPSPTVKIVEKTPSVLQEFIEKYDVLSKQRKLFYSCNTLSELFEESAELVPQELSDFRKCINQLWTIEPKLCADFVSSNRYIAPLPASEKNFFLHFQAVEEPYLTWKLGGFERSWWVMPNRIYLDFNHADQYFNGTIMNGFNLDKQTAMRLFVPSFQQAKEIVGEQMREMNMMHKEMVCLAAILLLETNIDDIQDATKQLISRLRNELIRDLLFSYEKDTTCLDPPEVRLGSLLLLVHAKRSQENLHILKFFGVCPSDGLFDEIAGIGSKGSASAAAGQAFTAAPASGNGHTAATPAIFFNGNNGNNNNHAMDVLDDAFWDDLFLFQ